MQAFTALSPGYVLREDPDPQAPRYSPRTARMAFNYSREFLGEDPYTIWDPFCGSGTGVATLAVLERGSIRHIYASDFRDSAVSTTDRNLSLCSADQIGALITDSSKTPISSARLTDFLEVLNRYDCKKALPFNVFSHDALTCLSSDHIPPRSVDLIITDPPYGFDSHWLGASEQRAVDRARLIHQMLEACRPALSPDGVVSLVLDSEYPELRDSRAAGYEWKRTLRINKKSTSPRHLHIFKAMDVVEDTLGELRLLQLPSINSALSACDVKLITKA